MSLESFKSNEVAKLFEQNGYKIVKEEWGIVIRNQSIYRRPLAIIGIVLGVVLLTISIQSGSWKVGLLSILLIGIPFTSVQWRMPFSVTLGLDRILINNLNSVEMIEASDLPELVVNYETRTAFVSPFEEGYRDHIYTFQLTTPVKKHNLFRIKSRTELTVLIEQLVADLSKLNIWKDEQ